MSNTTGITRTEIRDNTIENLQISNSAAIQELKIAFDTLTGHNHNGTNSRSVFGGGTSALVIDSSFTGVINGVNTTFTMSSNFMPNTTAVCVNGIRQKRITHFTETAPNLIVLDVAPPTGATLVFDYISA